MAEQMRVNRCCFTSWAVFRGAQRQDSDVGALGGLLDDQPRLPTLKRPSRTIGATLARKEKWLVVAQVLLFGPEQELTCQSQLGTGQKHSLDGLVWILPIGQHQIVAVHV